LANNSPKPSPHKGLGFYRGAIILYREKILLIDFRQGCWYNIPYMLHPSILLLIPAIIFVAAVAIFSAVLKAGEENEQTI
jgi:hypothetical protein